MKENEAPEKIWIHELSAKELNVPLKEYHIEYIRADAFIKKATLWLLTNASDYCILHNSYDTKELVKDFVDAMKRE